MGQCTKHWNAYVRNQSKGVLVMFALVVGGLAAIALITIAMGYVTKSDPTWLQITLLAIWLIAFTKFAIHYQRVTYPRCMHVYRCSK